MDGRILLIRGGAVGDFILTLPVIAALRRHFPKHRLEILGHPSVAALAVAGGLADGVVDLESSRFAGLFAEKGGASTEIAAWLSDFELIVSYLHDPRKIFESNVRCCTSARFVAGLHRPDESLTLHATTQLLWPLDTIGICDADPRPHLKFPDVKPVSPPCLAIHPGSGSVRKNWPESKWAELLKLVVDKTSSDILLIGGEAEGERCARLAAVLPSKRVRVAQNLPLVELAGEMQACAGFAGHDSGITHLAAALDLPGLALWGETSIVTWRPQSDRLKILRAAQGLEALELAEVWREMRNLL